jgi:hypothetical protein
MVKANKKCIGRINKSSYPREASTKGEEEAKSSREES